MDDAYIGGKQKGKRGRGAEGKHLPLNEEGHPIYMRLSVVSCFKKQEITDWTKKYLKEKN